MEDDEKMMIERIHNYIKARGYTCSQINKRLGRGKGYLENLLEPDPSKGAIRFLKIINYFKGNDPQLNANYFFKYHTPMFKNIEPPKIINGIPSFIIDITEIETIDDLDDAQYKNECDEIKKTIFIWLGVGIMPRQGEFICGDIHVFLIKQICYCDWKMMIKLEQQ
jgi:hypothetical protein